MYELNDIYYKLVLAKVLYEIEIFFMPYSNWNDNTFVLEDEDILNLSTDILSVNDYPKSYKYLVQQINLLFKYYLVNIKMNHNFPMCRTIRKNVKEEFERLGVIVNVVQMETPNNVNPLSNEELTTIKSNIEKIVESRAYVSREFIGKFLNQFNFEPV
jgi:hypothetical protein